MHESSVQQAVPIFHIPAQPDESFRLLEISGGYSGCSWHFHPEFQLGYVIQGRGQRVVGDSLHAIEPGEVILLGPNVPHVWRYAPATVDAPVEAVVIHFREDFLGNDFFRKPEMRDLRLLMTRACQGLQIVGSTRLRVVEILETLRIQAGFSRLLSLLNLLNLIAHSRDCMTLCSSLFQPVAAQLDLERLRRVCDHILAHFDQTIDRDSAADLAHMSPSAFSRFFKAHTGTTFQEFVADVRVGQACKLLMDNLYTITEIALRCGFTDLSTFNRTFRKLRNMTPTEYRSQIQRLHNL